MAVDLSLIRSAQMPDGMPPEKFLHSMIGYHIECGPSLCGIAMTQGFQKRVVNIGLGIKQIAVHPRGISVMDFIDSMKHKVSVLFSTPLHVIQSARTAH